MPKIPWFKTWFQNKFGELCEVHDAQYDEGKCKLCADYWLSGEIAWRGYPFLSVCTFIAVQMPWVWLEYLYKKYVK